MHDPVPAQKIRRREHQHAAGGHLRPRRDAERRKIAGQIAEQAQRAARAVAHRRQKRQTKRRRGIPHTHRCKDHPQRKTKQQPDPARRIRRRRQPRRPL